MKNHHRVINKEESRVGIAFAPQIGPKLAFLFVFTIDGLAVSSVSSSGSIH